MQCSYTTQFIEQFKCDAWKPEWKYLSVVSPEVWVWREIKEKNQKIDTYHIYSYLPYLYSWQFQLFFL